MIENNLEGQTLRVGITESSMLTDPYYGATDQTVKVLKIINLLQSQLNFTYQLISLPKASGIGIRQENGSWSGLIGLLERKEIDVIAERVLFLPHFRDAVDLSIPLGQDEWVTLQKQPSRLNSLTALLSPFEIEVWLLVALSIVGMIPVMFIIYRLHLKFHPQAANYFRGRLSDFVLFVVVSLLKQDHKLRISIHSQRVLMATWWIVGLLLTTFYTANLTASLARPYRERSLQHPRELSWPAYKDSKWLTLSDKLMPKISSHNQEFIKPNHTGATDFDLLSQHLKTGRGNLVSSIHAALNLTKRGYIWFGPYEMLLEVMLVNYRLNQANNGTHECSFLITDKRLSYLTVEYGLAFAKNSSLTPIFNQAIRLIDQSGILEFSRRASFTGKNPCSIGNGYTSRAMQLGDFLGLFCITLIGLSTATVTFIWERIPKYCKSWRKKTTNTAAVSPVSAVCKPVVPNQKISNANTYQLELEIEKLTEEIDRMLLTDKDIRGILYELFYTK
ncbi:glutamate receptor ionotropic, delta-1-like [Daphnia pulex]|uniref:glutamate receptor ionotropic, delta-1-like n=1 Tax=Daphnia pulex TaxID=6669 RepID=UPI001EDF9FE6|nr:glutamate receptor ionotropic, delta-1-like [Daphnia pulex]